jgi:hypothetical protein
MSMSYSLQTNRFLRSWVAPAEIAARSQAPQATFARASEGWRRGALRGAEIGYTVGSVLTLPIDLLGGTLDGSARKEVEAAHHKAEKQSGAPHVPMPFKQRFLLRLEDGVVGAAYVGAVVQGARAGRFAGGFVGVALGLAWWSVRAAGCGLYAGWNAMTQDSQYSHSAPEVPSFKLAVHDGWHDGRRMGTKLGGYACGVSLSLTGYVLSLASVGGKGACVAAGAVVGGLVGLGSDAADAWHCQDAPQSLVPDLEA